MSTALPCVFFVAHGKQDICHVPLSLPCVPFVAHGKYALCRVPEIVHTAKILTHGKLRVSGSGGNVVKVVVGYWMEVMVYIRVW